jgi:hypothetical protein
MFVRNSRCGSFQPGDRLRRKPCRAAEFEIHFLGFADLTPMTEAWLFERILQSAAPLGELSVEQSATT